MALEDGRVVIEFIVNALENKPLTIFGNGLSTRSFCYVSDLIKGIVAVMNQGGKDVSIIWVILESIQF